MANPTKIPPVNTVPADLNLARILDLTLKAFVTALLPVRAFSTAITGDILIGTKRVLVPYLPAETAASRDFNAANGDCYDIGNTNTERRPVDIDKRKYQPWGLTSEEVLNNSYLSNLNFAQQKGRKLAADVLGDILSPITPANFPGEIMVGPASTFDADEALDVREACNRVGMPKENRSLILDESYETGLLKYLKPYSVSGGTEVMREANVNRIAGFDEYGTTVLPDTNQLAGFAVYPSGLLVAMRPLEPLPSVRQLLMDYQVLTDPETGITLTYRHWADPDCDRENKIVECNYGYSVGEAKAIQRLIRAPRV